MFKPRRTIRSLVFGFLIAAGFAALGHIPLRAAVPAWTTVGAMSKARLRATASSLEDGRVLVAGGATVDTTVDNTVELFDPVTNTWSPAAAMARGRYAHVASTLPDGRVLVAGGVADGSSLPVTNTAEVYDPLTNAWSGAASMIRPRGAAAVVVLADSRVLVVGGTDGVVIHGDGEVYDPETNEWTLTGAMSDARWEGIAALLPDGRVLAAGGIDSANEVAPLNSAEVYDPDTNAWSPVSPMLSARAAPTAVVLDDDRVLVFGGIASADDTLTDGEVYDPVSNSWSSTPSAGALGGIYSAAALRTDGTVLAVGGAMENGTVASTAAAIYHPSSNTWSATFPSAIPRFFASVVPIPGARTLVTAGFGSTQTDVFGAPNSLPTAHAGPDQTIAGCASCLVVATLDGSGSTDPDQDALVYEWREGTTLLATATDPVKLTTAGLGVGVHILTLTVTDGAGGSASDNIRIEVVDGAGTVLTQLAQCQADRQALENGLEGTLGAIEQNLRAEFRNPDFTIPGGTPQARLQNLGFAITSMTRGQKMAIYRGLGGM